MEGENKSDYNNNNVCAVGDIEQNISNSPSDHVAPSTPPMGDDDDRMGEMEAAPPAQQLSLAKKVISIIFLFVGCHVMIGVYMVRIFLGGTKNFSTFSSVSSEDSSVELDEQGKKNLRSFYESVHWYEPTIAKAMRRSLTWTCRIGCLVLLWLVLTLTFHPLRRALKTSTFLGLIHWRWTLLATFVTLSYPIIFITIAFYFFAWNRIMKVVYGTSAQAQYYAIDVWAALSRSVVSLLHVASVFILWMLHFHGHANLFAGVDKYATRTLAVLLVGSFLWLLKDCLLIRWQQKAVYDKFRARILMSGFRLYVLCHVIDGMANTRLLPCTFQGSNMKKDVRHYLASSDSSLQPLPQPLKRNARQYIVAATHVSKNQIKGVARLVFSLTKMSKSIEDDPSQPSDIINAYREKIKESFSDSNAATTEAIIRRYLKLNSNQALLVDEMREEYPTKLLNQIPFDKWVVDAHKICLSTAYTLSDAFAMIKALNTILTSCLVIIVVVVWLLATELASTTVLVVIASPFLALSFVFGDVCKTFFQGFIFAFVTHPFDIGDRCIINEIEVEVKRINIMTTSCLKIGTNEKMLYPNSTLATSLITNLGDKLDPTDAIELVLHPSTNKTDLSSMQEHIEKFVDSDEQRECFEKACKVVVKEMKNGVKIGVYFQHTMDSKDVSYSQFLEKRERQRSILFLEIKEFLDKLGVQIAFV